MQKVFLDANIFFAAARSPKGGSGFILELAKKNKIKIVTANHALLEAERNIKQKLGQHYLSQHHQNLLDIKPSIQPIGEISSGELEKLERLLPVEDIPILVGAVLSKTKILITLDRKHFLDNRNLKQFESFLELKNPGDFLKKYIR